MPQSTPALTVKVVPPSSGGKVVLLATLGNGCTTPPSIGNLVPVYLSDLTNNSFTIPKGFSGRIHVFMSPKNLSPSDLKSLVPTVAANINTKLTSLRYDFVEITYDGTPTASANLSSVDQLGIALSMRALDSGNHKIQSVGYKSSLQDIFNVFNPDNKGRAIPDSFTRILSPLNADESSRPDLSAYLKSLDGKTINLVGNFDGSTDGNKVRHNAAPFNYTCNFQHDKVVLKASTISGIQGNIEIPDLPNMIFPCDGIFNVPSTTAGPNKNGIADKVGFNDPWSTVVRNFLVGFNLGFYGFQQMRDGYNYDCNNSWDWEADFAFNNPFTSGASWNVYAQIIWDHSNSYGFPFSDLLGKPLVQINNAAILQVTILDDNATNDDYTPPTPTPTPQNQKPDVTNPTSGNNKIPNSTLNKISIIFDGGVGSTNSYKGNVVFAGKTFSFGFGAEWDSPANQNPQAPGNCSIFHVPSNVSQTIQYSFSFGGKPFNLYTKLDGAGNIASALVDGGLDVSISSDFTSVTISKIREHIKPPATIETVVKAKSVNPSH